MTLSGRVTDQNTAQGIADVAIVAQGNQTGTRVVITDVQGNYTLPFGANTNIKLRAYKTGFVLNPAFFGFASMGGPAITGTLTRDFAGASLPFPIIIFVQAPILLTEDESLNALALDAVLDTRDPFPLVSDNYFGAEKRTRIKLLLVDLDLYSGESGVLPVEDLRKAPGFPWLAQLTALLPSDLTGPNDLSLSVSARGQTSNSVNLRIK